MRWRVGRTMTCWVALIALLLIDGGAARAQESRRCFAETGQCISGPIRTYWERNGGLPTFGLPISAAREELVLERLADVLLIGRPDGREVFVLVARAGLLGSARRGCGGLAGRRRIGYLRSGVARGSNLSVLCVVERLLGIAPLLRGLRALWRRVSARR